MFNLNEVTKDMLSDFNVARGRELLKKRYSDLLSLLKRDGAFIFGCKRLGLFAKNQLKRNNIVFRGFVDNNIESTNFGEKIISPTKLSSTDVVIISSISHVEISGQLNAMNVHNNIYYEELALVLDGFDTYYQGFIGFFSEIENNKEAYMKVFEVLSDNISLEVYSYLMLYRMTMSNLYTCAARGLSTVYGEKDFDIITRSRFTCNTNFYDVGGFDGESSRLFSEYQKEHGNIYIFEPDESLMKNMKQTTKNLEHVTYINAAVGDKEGDLCFMETGLPDGKITNSGDKTVKCVRLNDYIHSSDSYIKMDIEGYEMQALKGMENSIREYHPMMAIAVYHLSGDIHKIILTVLDWYPQYKCYLRHYSNTYEESVCYFVSE